MEFIDLKAQQRKIRDSLNNSIKNVLKMRSKKDYLFLED